MEKEVWRDVVGYEGRYKISNQGRVWSVSRKKNMSVWESDTGYYMISLYKGGRTKNYRVHRLVAIAFIPREANKNQVNHLNENKKDNRVGNLEWVTPKENTRHGTGIKRRSQGKSKAVMMLDRDSEEVLLVFDSVKSAGGFLQRHYRKGGPSGVSESARGILNTSSGYKWVFMEDYTRP